MASGNLSPLLHRHLILTAPNGFLSVYLDPLGAQLFWALSDRRILAFTKLSLSKFILEALLDRSRLDAAERYGS